MIKYTTGADPEVFVGDATGVKSIIGKIGGSKHHPQALPLLGKGFGVQEDNVAMEFTIPPAATRAEFIHSIDRTVEFLSSVVNDMYGYNLVKDSALSFPESELQHPMAMAFGCDPDFNAWTGRRNPSPQAADKSLRSAGGHVHIGIKQKMTAMEKRSIIQRMDLFAGVPSVLMDNGELRKKLYGKAGAFRHKPYGVEYRTLSNFWIFDKKLIGWVHDQVGRALNEELKLKINAQQIQACINTNDKSMAKRLVEVYGLDVL